MVRYIAKLLLSAIDARYARVCGCSIKYTLCDDCSGQQHTGTHRLKTTTSRTSKTVTHSQLPPATSKVTITCRPRVEQAVTGQRASPSLLSHSAATAGVCRK